ncbi:MAG: RdgB/HAM1 family non-canonical purine NTP pyrophosphatase [Anaerolineales bacterium]
MTEKPRLLVATTNPGKQREYRALLRGVPAEIVFPDELGITLEVEEDGATFRENAAKKARALAQASGLLTVADDSGLEVEALGGEPGVRSARYPGPGADDPKRRGFLLGKLRHVPAPRRARFVCVIAIATPDGATEYAEGECRGEITLAERGTNGFGYDPVFQVEGRPETMAEISAEEKNRISHRARAARAAMPILRGILSAGEIE